VSTVLPNGLPTPKPDALDAPYWEGTRAEKLLLQRCESCRRFQWGPEWICHRCRSFDLTFDEVEPTGIVYSWQRVWHPVHPALTDAVPYVILLVELPHADGVRVVGNLFGDPHETVTIGAPVSAVFEHHESHSLVHWRLMT